LIDVQNVHQVFFFILKYTHENMSVLSKPKDQGEESMLILSDLLVLRVRLF
jgi:hypothetical protein